MTPVEFFVGLILLLLAVPDLCDRIGRPALVYTIYLIVGMVFGPAFDPGVQLLLREIGQIGFILLLFEVGLDIDLPAARHWWTPLKVVAKWNAAQYPLVYLLAKLAGLTTQQAFLAAVALNAASVSMTFVAWRHFSAPTQENKRHLLLWMISLEIVAIVILTAGGILLKHGFGIPFVSQLALIALVVVVIGRFGDKLTQHIGKKLASTIKWKVHYIVLFILGVAALADRAGLSAPKAAFFLGLFISRATHEGIALTHHIRPIGQRLLIPVFFLALGAAVPQEMLFKPVALKALFTAVVLLGIRDVLHRTYVQSGCGRRAFLLVCPNLTIVAIAAATMIGAGAKAEATAWLVLTGFFITVLSIFLLPPENETPPARRDEPEKAKAAHGPA